MTVTRVATSGPRKGVLALLEGPTFDKGKMPPIPDSANGFAVMSVDLDASWRGSSRWPRPSNPGAEEPMEAFQDR